VLTFPLQRSLSPILPLPLFPPNPIKTPHHSSHPSHHHPAITSIINTIFTHSTPTQPIQPTNQPQNAILNPHRPPGLPQRLRHGCSRRRPSCHPRWIHHHCREATSWKLVRNSRSIWVYLCWNRKLPTLNIYEQLWTFFPIELNWVEINYDGNSGFAAPPTHGNSPLLAPTNASSSMDWFTALLKWLLSSTFLTQKSHFEADKRKEEKRWWLSVEEMGKLLY